MVLPNRQAKITDFVKNKHYFQYYSVIRPIYHDPDLPDPELDDNMEYSSGSEHGDMTVVAKDDTYKPEEVEQPVPLTQAELNDLTRNLNLSEEFAQLLGSETFNGPKNNVLMLLRLR